MTTMNGITDPHKAKIIENLAKEKPKGMVWLLQDFHNNGFPFEAGYAFNVKKLHIQTCQELLRHYLKGKDSELKTADGDIKALEKVVKDGVNPAKIDHTDFSYLFDVKEEGGEGESEGEPVQLVIGKNVITEEMLELKEVKAANLQVGDTIEVCVRDDSALEAAKSAEGVAKEALYTEKQKNKAMAKQLKAMQAELKKAKTTKSTKELASKTAKAEADKKVKAAAEAKKIEEAKAQGAKEAKQAK